MQTTLNYFYLRLILIVLFLLIAAQGSSTINAASMEASAVRHLMTVQTPVEWGASAQPQPPPPYQLFLPFLQQDTSPASAILAAQLSTPQLLAQALANGEITADEQALYLAYALYEPQSLPDRFHSNVGWYGTQYVVEVQDYLQNMSAASTDAVQQELSRLRTLAATVCDNEDGPNSTNSTNFRFNYNTIAGGLTINHYRTSMETTFNIEVTQFGWANPPLCTGGATCDGVDNPFNRYPVQIFDLGGGLYGYVSSGSGGLYTGFIGDNPNTTAIETNALSSCMVLNNDFSQFPEGAQGALDSTTSHEFVHAIQNGYGDPGTREDSMWYESGAAYMEDEIFDSANSDYQYLWPVVSNSLGQWPNNAAPGGISQYSNFLFFRHVAEHNGGTNVAGGGEDIMQHFWENVAAGQAALTAYNNALVAEGTTLADAFHRYAIAARFSKTCGAGYVAPYCFEEGAAYVAAAGAPSPVQGSIAASPGTFNGNIRNHYAANWINLPTSGGPYQVDLSNTAAGGQLRGSVVCDTGSAFTIVPFPSVVSAGNSTTIGSFNPTGCTRVTAIITNQEQTSGNPGSVPSHSYTLAVSASSQTAAITIVLDARPDGPTDLGFNGTLGAFYLDDAAVDDGDAYAATRTFIVAPGTYTVHRNNGANWFTTAIDCTPTTGTSIDLPNRRATLTVSPGDAVTCTFTVDRGVVIRTRAFNDLVRNGTNEGKRNAGDPWLENWEMIVATAPTTIVTSGLTRSTATAGLYEAIFRTLRPGSYTVCQTLQDGWTNTSPGAIDPAYNKPCKPVTLSPGQGALLLFGNYQSGTAAVEVSAAAEEIVTDTDQIYDLPIELDEGEILPD